MGLRILISRLLACLHRSDTRGRGSIFYLYILMICLGLFSMGILARVGSHRSGGSGTLLYWRPIGGGGGETNSKIQDSFEMAEVWWEGEANTHIVEDGDDLWTLASDYGVQVEEIVRANGFSYARRLQSGQQLRIPRAVEVGSDLLEQCLPSMDLHGRALTQMEWPPLTKTVHVVQPGENLWDISRHHGVDVPTLFGANEFLDGGYIYPGDEIVVLSQKRI